jgi:hypothetical protein
MLCKELFQFPDHKQEDNLFGLSQAQRFVSYFPKRVVLVNRQQMFFFWWVISFEKFLDFPVPMSGPRQHHDRTLSESHSLQ